METEKKQILWIAGTILFLLLMFTFFIIQALHTGEPAEGGAPSEITTKPADRERPTPRRELPTLGGSEQRIGGTGLVDEILGGSETASTPTPAPARRPLLPTPVTEDPPAVKNNDLPGIDQTPIQSDGVSLKNDPAK